MSRVRLAGAGHAQSQTSIVQGIQEAGHVVIPHPQTGWRSTAKGRLGDVEKVMQSSLVQAETALMGSATMPAKAAKVAPSRPSPTVIPTTSSGEGDAGNRAYQ